MSIPSSSPHVEQVIAGPGSGKTTYVLRVLTDALQAGTPATALLGLTFSTKAAEEMNARLKAQLPGHPLPWMGTFHALALKLLHHAGRGPKDVGKALPHLIPDATALLQQTPPPAWIRALQILAIDETQDLDPSQVEFLKTLLSFTPPTCHVLLVGDPQQAIYEFRKASAEFLLHPERYLDRPVETVILDKNYRSAREIVKLAQMLLNEMPAHDDSPRTLIAARPEDHPAIRSLVSSSAEQEARRIFEEIRTLIAVGLPLQEISILTRTRKQLDILRMEASRWGLHTYTPPLHDLLNPKDTPEAPLPPPATPPPAALSLMTIHQAKGREWLVTFIAGCQDGLIPHSLSTTPAALDEERRLLFVAVTRPKQLLWISRWGHLSPYLALAEREHLVTTNRAAVTAHPLPDHTPTPPHQSGPSTTPPTAPRTVARLPRRPPPIPALWQTYWNTIPPGFLYLIGISGGFVLMTLLMKGCQG